MNGSSITLSLAAGLVLLDLVRRAPAKGSRGQVIDLAEWRTKAPKDNPRFTHYTVSAPPHSDWLIEAGFATPEAAHAHRVEMKRVWGRVLKIAERADLIAHRADPREDRRWMKGRPFAERPVAGDPGATPLQMAKIAVHNTYWWRWGHPFGALDEAVVDPRTHPTARQWSTTAPVVILREHGLPDDGEWWAELDTEMKRLGANLYHESINAGVYALYADR